jgi:hypothetical protein
MRTGRAFAQLQAANPVPIGPQSPWRRSTIRIALALAALAVAFLLAAPAVGVRVPILDFWTAEKAPPKVVEDFESLAEGAPAGMDPEAIPGETRKVTLAGGGTVWVAPTRAGGFCTEHGCNKLGTFPLEITWAASGPLPSRDGVPHPLMADFDLLEGAANSRYVDTVEVRFRDGEVDRPKLTWVSEPIHHGFFEYRVPAAHRRSHQNQGRRGRDLGGADAIRRTVRVARAQRSRPSLSPLHAEGLRLRSD